VKFGVEVKNQRDSFTECCSKITTNVAGVRLIQPKSAADFTARKLGVGI